MDQVPLSFDIPPTRTVDVQGASSIPISTTGNERRSCTVVLCCAANGLKLLSILIFKRKTLPKGNFPKGVEIHANENGWVAAIRHISHSCLDPNDFTVVNCIVKGHASLSPPSLRLRLRSRFTLLAIYTYFDPKDFSPHPSTVSKGCGRSDHGRHVTSSSPVPLKHQLRREAMHVKSVESSNVLLLVW
ncbi:hypothetical protein TNCV_4413131 [Trichonephila clavipes]|nr:hypothetical protein TNCV_4413131 [Trichonephila clavipes]